MRLRSVWHCRVKTDGKVISHSRREILFCFHFANYWSSMAGPPRWAKVVEDMAERTGLPRLTTHTIRHTRFTDLARSGLDLH